MLSASTPYTLYAQRAPPTPPREGAVRLERHTSFPGDHTLSNSKVIKTFPEFTHSSLSRYLLNAYCIPGAVPGAL